VFRFGVIRGCGIFSRNSHRQDNDDVKDNKVGVLESRRIRNSSVTFKRQHHSLLKDVSLLRLVLLSVETCLECDVHTRQLAFGGEG